MSSISTTVLIMSDTHGKLIENLPDFPLDVVIHCGDITDGSQLHEYETALHMLISIDAAVKIVIPGNHDWTLDACAYERMLQDALQHDITIEEFEAAYGRPTIFGEAYDLLTSQRAREAGVLLLESDMRNIKLESGAELRVATSPETPSAYGNMGFVYSPSYPPSWHFANSNGQDIDILITHGPPRGIIDMTEGSGRIGCSSLFEAVAQVKPRVHCFGHVHRCWGARLVQWRDEMPEVVSHITAIDNHNCKTIANLAFPDAEQPHFVEIDEHIEPGKQTLFVNAAIEAPQNEPQHKPFIVTLDLPIS